MLPCIATGLGQTFIAFGASVKVCGRNGRGSLGTGNTEALLPMSPINTSFLDHDEAIIKASLDESTTVILTSKGRLFGCGENNLAQLSSDLVTTHHFRLLDLPIMFGDERIIDVATYGGATFVLTSEGQLFARGANRHGKLGIGAQATSPDFTKVPLPHDARVKQMVMGGSKSIILLSDGKLMVCGNNADGKLGTGNTTSSNTFVYIAHSSLPQGTRILQVQLCDSISILLSNGQLFECMPGFTTFKHIIEDFNIPESIIIKSIARGYGLDLHIITEDQRIFRLQHGNPYLGTVNQIVQINLGLHPNETIVDATGGVEHLIILTSLNRVLGAGNSREDTNQLGLPLGSHFMDVNPAIILAHLFHPAYMAPRDIPSREPTIKFSHAEEQPSPDAIINLPDELLLPILSRFSPAEIENLLCVCQTFYKKIFPTYRKMMVPRGYIPGNSGLIQFSAILEEARAMYNMLNAHEKAEFKELFMRCFPSEVYKNPKFAKILTRQ